MQAIIDAIAKHQLEARVSIVMSDNSGAQILRRAEANDIPFHVIDCGGYKSKFPLTAQREAAETLKRSGVDLVCLAGFMRLVKGPLLEAFPSRIINIHPSLLPAFPGVAAWEQAIEANANETGVTVHVVDSGMDTGPVILQESLPIFPGETSEQLHQRIQLLEHRLYPEAIKRHANEIRL